MIKETKYGIISDIHNYPHHIIPAIQVLKNLGAQKLIINGDIANPQETLEDSRNLVAGILNELGKSEIETYLQPGSHETVGMWEPVMDYFSDKYSNIIDALKTQKIEQNGHEIAFLPGSDWVAGGEYHLINGKKATLKGYETTNTGLHFIDPREPDKAIPTKNFKTYVQEIQKRQQHLMPQHYINMNDLKKTITNPEKTTVFCHVPRLFNNPEQGIDMAEFGEVKKQFFANIIHYKDGEQQIKIFSENYKTEIITKPKPIELIVRNQSFYEGTVFPLPVALTFVEAGGPIEIKKENRGNLDLKKLYEEIGITKSITGHFHESAHRAHDSNCNPIQPNMKTNELFWNASYLDKGLIGILTVKDAQVSYQNINLKDYLR
jgi:Icc-related predicted phosphoesterase